MTNAKVQEVKATGPSYWTPPPAGPDGDALPRFRKRGAYAATGDLVAGLRLASLTVGPQAPTKGKGKPAPAIVAPTPTSNVVDPDLAVVSPVDLANKPAIVDAATKGLRKVDRSRPDGRFWKPVDAVLFDLREAFELFGPGWGIAQIELKRKFLSETLKTRGFRGASGGPVVSTSGLWLLQAAVAFKDAVDRWPTVDESCGAIVALCLDPETAPLLNRAPRLSKVYEGNPLKFLRDYFSYLQRTKQVDIVD